MNQSPTLSNSNGNLFAVDKTAMLNVRTMSGRDVMSSPRPQQSQEPQSPGVAPPTVPTFNLSTTHTASHIQLQSKLNIIHKLNAKDTNKATAAMNVNYNAPDEEDLEDYIHQDDYDFVEPLQDRPLTKAEYNDLKTKKESSLDFHPIVNNLYLINEYSASRRQRFIDAGFRWLATVMIAFGAGLIGASIRIVNARVNTYKFGYMQDYLNEDNLFAAWGVLVSWSLLMLACSSAIVLFFEMKANGSGIPDIKSSLNGMNIRGVFTKKTLLAKLFATAFLVNSTCPTGTQGPVLHMGAVLGGWFPSIFKWLIKRVFCCMQEHEEMRDLDDIPLRPNPCSANVYTQGYFQRVYHNSNNIHIVNGGEDNDLVTPLLTTQQQQPTANDLFLQDVGVPIQTNSGVNNNNNNDGSYYTKQYPQRTDINDEKKPSLRSADGYIDPDVIQNLTVDDDLVPVTNTGRRFLAQTGVVIEAPGGPSEDVNDYIKLLSNPKQFGSEVNANGGVVGLVVKNKRVALSVPTTANNNNNNNNTSNDAINTNNMPSSPTQNNARNGSLHSTSGTMLVSDDALDKARNINGHIYDLNDDSAKSSRCCPAFIRRIHVPSLNNDRDRRDFISIGSASGVSAVMGAALGGFCFAFEEMASHWRQDLSLKVLAAATVSYLVAAFFAQGNVDLWGIFSSAANTLFVGRRNIPFYIEEVPAFILLGVCMGIIGATYTFITISIMRWRNRIMSRFKTMIPRFCDTLFIGLIFVTLLFVVPMAWPCEAIPADYAQARTLYGGSAGTYDVSPYNCPAGFYNKFASLSLVRPDFAIKKLLARGIPNNFEAPELLVWAVLYTMFTAILQQTNASWGAILPLMLIGTAWGRLIGKAFHEAWGATVITAGAEHIYFDPAVYAAVGLSAIFASVTRSVLGMTVVVLEMKSDISLIIPMLIGTFVSHIVGSLFSPSLFIAIINERKLPYLHEQPADECRKLTAKQLMLPKPHALGCAEKVGHILRILETSHHSAYPVVLEPCTALYHKGETCDDSAAHIGEDCDMNYLGLIHRKHLLLLLNRRVWRATSTPFTIEDFERVNERAAPTVGELRARLTAQDLDSFIDLAPWMTRSSLLVTEGTNAAQAYYLFRAMGLRHLPVIDGNKQLTGIITRLELLDAVVKHRYSELRREEFERVKNQQGLSLVQNYIERNTAYHLVTSYNAQDELQYKRKHNHAQAKLTQGKSNM